MLALALYCGFLCWRRGRGPLCAPPEPALFAARHGAPLRVLLTQPPREDARGLWMEGELLDHPGQRARLRWSGLTLFQAPRPGEEILLVCGLSRPRLGRNPGDFNERRHLEDRGVQWNADCAPPLQTLSARGALGLLRSAAEGLRRALERAWRAELSALDARMMAGLALGYKGPLDRDLARQAQDAGVIHLLVPSGAKVAVVLLAVGALCALARAPPALELALLLAVGGFFTLAVGGEPPYARAWLSACFSRLGALLDRDKSAFQSTVFAAWAQLLWDPAALFTMGFQMSYACALVLAAAFEARAGRARGFLGSAREQLLVTALVEAALWPVFASGFGRAALVGALGNVALVPFCIPLVGLGWALAAGAPVGWAVGAGLSLFRAACAFFAGLPGAAVDLEPMGGAATAAFYIALAGLLLRLSLRARCALWGLALIFVLGNAALARRGASNLSVLYLSVKGFRPAALVRRRLAPPMLITHHHAEAALRRASRAYGWGEPEGVVSIAQRPGYRACEGRVCLRFDQPCFHGPSGEFCILALLKKHAVEVSTDGSSIQIRQASDQLRRRLL